jgi:predicted SnoaL-like aldol condensation-catalyzing enzyme
MPRMMLKRLSCLVLTLVSWCAWAQTPVTANADHAAMLASHDPGLAANKRLVYDLWREVFEAGRMDLAEKYLAENYIQHNPNVPNGRAGFVAVFSKLTSPKPVQARVAAPLVAIVAEKDLVVLLFVRTDTDPRNSGPSSTTTWFDAFRIKDGQVAEHWDPDVRR